MKHKKSSTLQSFEGKCLSISIKDDTYNHDLLDPYLEYLGDRIFIIGTIPKGATDSNWTKNKTGAVAWDSVKEYIVFDNFEDYKKATSISEKHDKNRKKKKKKSKKN